MSLGKSCQYWALERYGRPASIGGTTTTQWVRPGADKRRHSRRGGTADSHGTRPATGDYKTHHGWAAVPPATTQQQGKYQQHHKRQEVRPYARRHYAQTQCLVGWVGLSGAVRTTRSSLAPRCVAKGRMYFPAFSSYIITEMQGRARFTS